jgi:Serine dehydrogenase proteinase
MSRAGRKGLIANLERLRERRVIAYVTGDRPPNLAAQIATDTLPLFYGLLAKIGQTERLDLFIYSTGGITMAAWGLVNLLREFAKHLSVLVPFRALSTATLIALGADEILMGRLGQLSPVDPSVVSPFNPPAPQQPGVATTLLPVSVEDVRGFVDLARDEAQVKDEKLLAEVFKQLAADVRPLALGSVHRAKEQIKILTEKLLWLHTQEADKARVAGIVETFTRKLFSHDYLIGRKEARAILGERVTDAPENIEAAMWNLYLAYAEDLELSKPYSAEAALGPSNQKVVGLQRAYVETAEGSFVFKTTREVRRVQLKQQGVPVAAVQERLIDEGWTLETG